MKSALVLGVVGLVVAACGGSTPAPPDAPKPPEPASTVVQSADPPKAPDPVPAKLSADECKKLSEEGSAEMDAEQIKVDHECKADGDCVAVTGRACSFKCMNAAIPKNDQANWDAELTKVKDGPCKKWTDGECATTTPPPATCKDEGKKAKCVNKHCVLR